MTVEELIEALGCYDKSYEVIINLPKYMTQITYANGSTIKCVHGDGINKLVNIDIW